MEVMFRTPELLEKLCEPAMMTEFVWLLAVMLMFRGELTEKPCMVSDRPLGMFSPDRVVASKSGPKITVPD